MESGGNQGQPFMGAYFCEGWELRITQRCAEEDLQLDGGASFEELAKHSVVKKFVARRSETIKGTSQLGPALRDDGPTLEILRDGDSRAVTAFDATLGVCWLLAVHPKHRSGIEEDSFNYFDSLMENGRLFPTVVDTRRALKERRLGLAIAVMVEAPVTLRDARNRSGEFAVFLGRTHWVRMAIELADDLESITVAFDTRTVTTREMSAVLAGFYSDDDWIYVDHMPSGRKLKPGIESGWQHTHAV